MYWIERLVPSEGKSGLMSLLKIQHQYTQLRTLMRFHAAEILPNPSTAAMSVIIKQRGLPEDNIIVAGDSQFARRAC
jgi:hypothetical protein